MSMSLAPTAIAPTRPLQSARRYLGLTGIAIPQGNPCEAVCKALEEFKRKHLPYDPDDPPILHREDIKERNGVFRVLHDAERRAAFDADLLGLLQSVPMWVCCRGHRQVQPRQGPSQDSSLLLLPPRSGRPFVLAGVECPAMASRHCGCCGSPLPDVGPRVMCAACGRATSTWLVVDADGRVTGAGTSNGAAFRLPSRRRSPSSCTTTVATSSSARRHRATRAPRSCWAAGREQRIRPSRPRPAATHPRKLVDRGGIEPPTS
jgi:hypothetical protein